MKQIFLGTAAWVLLIPMAASAAWDTGGNNVTQFVSKRFDHFPKQAPDGQGGAFVAWDTEDDVGSYDLDVAVCRVSFEGEVLWSAIVSAQAAFQVGAEIVEDGAGGAIVVWFDERTTGLGAGIYAQRYDPDGVAQWGTDGVWVSDIQPLVVQPDERMRVVTDGAGGALVVWQDYYQRIWAQHVRSDGYLPWGVLAVGVTMTQGGGDYACDAATDGSGGLLVTWTNSAISSDIRAQRFDAGGARLWGNEGVYVKGPDPDEQEFPKIVSTASGDAIVVWDDFAYGGSWSVRAQRLDANGAGLWAAAGVLISTAGIDVTDDSARLASDGADGAVVIWTDNRNEPSAKDLFAVHLTSTGSTGAPVPITAAESRVEDAVIVSDGNGGAFLAWRLHDSVNGPVLDAVHYQWLDSSLANLFTSGGVLVFDVAAAQTYPLVVMVSPGQFILAWEFENVPQESSDCYALLVEGNTTPGPNVTVSPVDLTTGTTPVAVTFSDVTSQGETSLSTSPSGPPTPGTFMISGTYYHITTTASFSGTIEICIVDSAVVDASYRMQHHDGVQWTDITSFVDPAQHTICGVTTSLSPFVVGYEQEPSAVGDNPRQFALRANVPNPFNPLTTIGYAVAAGGAHVEIVVIDAAGRIVRSLVDAYRAAGEWSVQWNGDDDQGRRVASGVYFYRMRAGSFVQTRKMVLLK